MLKKILIAFGLVGLLPFAVSCGEEDGGSSLAPKIYEQVSMQLKFMPTAKPGEHTDCSTSDAAKIQESLKKYIEDNEKNLRDACTDEKTGYETELKKAGNSYTLATERNNSGYYAGVYIFLSEILVAIDHCSAGAERETLTAHFEEMYEKAGCTSILEDAIEFYEKWNREF